MVVWIEIFKLLSSFCNKLKSPPAWWCGLKLYILDGTDCLTSVTTCVVVWIEICIAEVPVI